MKRLKFPTSTELAIFAAMAVLCAAIVKNSTSWDLALSALSFPVALAAGVMGLWRSGRLYPGGKVESEAQAADTGV